MREEVRKNFERNAKGYCYFPMFLPFGGWTTDVMIDEVRKLSKTAYRNECA